MLIDSQTYVYTYIYTHTHIYIYVKVYQHCFRILSVNFIYNNMWKIKYCKFYNIWHIVVVVVFYWPLGSKQISRSIYIHITHTKHGKKLTSAHQSNKEINHRISICRLCMIHDFFPKYVKTGIQILFRNEVSHHCPDGESLSCGNYTTHTYIQIATAIRLRTTPKPEMSSFR